MPLGKMAEFFVQPKSDSLLLIEECSSSMCPYLRFVVYLYLRVFICAWQPLRLAYSKAPGVDKDMLLRHQALCLIIRTLSPRGRNPVGTDSQAFSLKFDTESSLTNLWLDIYKLITNAGFLLCMRWAFISFQNVWLSVRMPSLMWEGISPDLVTWLGVRTLNFQSGDRTFN